VCRRFRLQQKYTHSCFAFALAPLLPTPGGRREMERGRGMGEARDNLTYANARRKLGIYLSTYGLNPSTGVDINFPPDFERVDPGVLRYRVLHGDGGAAASKNISHLPPVPWKLKSQSHLRTHISIASISKILAEKTAYDNGKYRHYSETSCASHSIPPTPLSMLRSPYLCTMVAPSLASSGMKFNIKSKT
jgi:hypothetical protein